MSGSVLIPSLKQMIAELVAIPSVSSTLPEWDQGNRRVIERLASWCESLGYQVETQCVDTATEKYNLIATLGPANVPGGLVLSGHTDTVPYDSKRWQSDPFSLEERDGRWYALGITDMKAFFALALHASVEWRGHLQRPLVLVATADEESNMSGIRALSERLKTLQAPVLIGEPTGMSPIYAHKGILMEELSIQGQSGHSSEPALGNNAIDAMNAALSSLSALRQEWSIRYRAPDFKVPEATLNFGCLHGGDNPNRICAHCALQFDVRLVPGLSSERARDEIQEALAGIDRQFGVQLNYTPLFKGVPAFQGEKDGALVRDLERLSGRKADTVAFATEASFFQEAGLSTVVWGPGNIAQAHQPNEYLDLDRVSPAVELLSQLIRAYCVDASASNQS